MDRLVAKGERVRTEQSGALEVRPPNDGSPKKTGKKPLREPPPPSSGGTIPKRARGAAGMTRMMSPAGMGEKLERTRFEAAFTKVAGPEAIEALQAMFSDSPVVLIGGDQATGKGTLATALAAAMGGEATSVGKASVRKMAAARGVTVEEMGRMLKTMPDVDRQIDYAACQAIASGSTPTEAGGTTRLAALDSRLAGHLGQFLRRLGRQNIVTVYLGCAPREQALRFVNRELSPQAKDALDRVVPHDPALGMAECVQALSGLELPGAEDVARRFDEIAARDDVDRDRFLSLYGVDYRDTASYDLVVDTSGKTPDEVRREVIALLPHGFVGESR
ncbi:MAG: hypothetical protein HY903_15660 [Deltaproteobacteria bacterium]|nr:hypothetical protein [Deltaproteobacteria bacterium]